MIECYDTYYKFAGDASWAHREYESKMTTTTESGIKRLPYSDKIYYSARLIVVQTASTRYVVAKFNFCEAD